MFSNEQKKANGEYLRVLITKPDENGEEIPLTHFYKRYLNDLGIKINDDELKRIKNRFSAILNGRNNINPANDDLVIISRLLGVSIEEILSAGKKRYDTPEFYVKNYDLAASSDKSIWEKYITGDNDSLVCRDEHGKTILDYAVGFRNYSLIRYMIDKKIIWFTSNQEDSEKIINIMDFGGGTNVGKSDYNDLSREITHDDSLRKAISILAIENEDYEILSSLRARETLKELAAVNYGADYSKSNYSNMNIADEIDAFIVGAISNTKCEEIIDYFSEEFEIIAKCRRNPAETKFIYSHIDQVIEMLVCNSREKDAEKVLRKAIEHNKRAFEKVNERIEKSIEDEFEAEKIHLDEVIEEMRKNGCSEEQIEICKAKRLDKTRMKQVVLDYEIKFDSALRTVSFNHRMAGGLVVNIVKAKTEEIKNSSENIRQLINELNTWYRKTIELGGEKYAEVLHEL